MTDELIAIGAFVLVVGAIVAAVTGVAKGTVKLGSDHHTADALSEVAYTMRRDSQDALAWFIPSTDVLGASNADGHAVAAYFRNASTHQATFLEWVCTGDCAIGSSHAGGTLQRYSFTTFTNPSASLATDGPAMTGVSLAASYLPVSQLGTAGTSTFAGFFSARFSAAGYTPTDRLVNLGFPGVYAGNRITVVKLENKLNAFELHLLPLAVPTTNNGAVIGFFTPAPNAMSCSYSSGTACPSTTLTFQYPDSPAGQIVVSEPNYPSTSTYTETDTCSGIATIAAAGTPSGPSATWNVTPLASGSGGDCTATVTDWTKQQITMSVHVGNYDAPAYTLVVSSVPSTVTTGSSVGFTATANLNSGLHVRAGTTSSLPVGITAISGPCSYSPGGWQGSGTAFTVTGTSFGTCSFTVGTNGSATNSPQSFTVNDYDAPQWALQISGPGTTSLQVGGGGTTFVASAPVTNSSNVQPPVPGPLNVGITAATGSCGFTAGWQTSGTTFSVWPGSSADTCVLTVSANGTASNNPQTITFTVAATPASPPSPAPTATATPFGACTSACSTVTLWNAAANTGDVYYDSVSGGSMGAGYKYYGYDYAWVTITTTVAPVDAAHALVATVYAGSAASGSCSNPVPIGTFGGAVVLQPGSPPTGAMTKISGTGGTTSPVSVSYYSASAAAGTYSLGVIPPTSACSYTLDSTYTYPVTITQAQP